MKNFILLIWLSVPTLLVAQVVYFDWLPTDTIFVEPAAEFEVAIRVSGFQEAGAFQFSLGWDGSQLDFLGYEQAGLSDMIFNTLPVGLGIAWYDASGLGRSLPDSTVILRLLFRARSTMGPMVTQVSFTATPLPFEFYQLIGQTLISVPVNTTDKTVVIRNCGLSINWPINLAYCTGDSLLLTPSCIGCANVLQWENGDSAPSQWITAPGWVNVLGEGIWRCSIRDSAWVSELPLPELELPDEEILCAGEAVLLGPNTVNSSYSYQWSDGVTSPYRNADTPGLYTLNAISTDGCQRADTVWVREIPILDGELVASIDTVCLGSSVNIVFAGGMFPQWQDTSGRLELLTPTIATLRPLADTRIRVNHENECFSETLELLIHVRNPTLLTSPDTAVQSGSRIVLYAAGGTQYRWSGPEAIGSITDSSLQVAPSKSAWYYIRATDAFGCQVRDSIWVEVLLPRRVYAPNAFSPNRDGINDFFTLFGGQDLEEIEYLAIYDRWGQLAFEKHHFPPNVPTEGWDGNFLDEIHGQAVFVYFAELRFRGNQKEKVKGEVILLR